MAYTDDAVLAKLSALNETHDSIATAAQWIMFHRRHAERTVQLWFQRLKDSPSPKRLNLVYLANEVTQQSKARHKEDFVVAFAPVIAEAVASAYKGAPSEVQAKLRRVVEVWRDRSIFEAPIQAAVESRIEELDKARGSSRTAIGGSIFGGGGGHGAGAGAALPQEFAPLVAPQQKVTKLLMATQGSVSRADAEYDKIMNSPPPAPPVYVARLHGLVKALADGEAAMTQMVQARTELKAALDQLQAQYQKLLDADAQCLQQLAQRRLQVDEKKREVEDKILRDLGSLDRRDSATTGGGAGAAGFAGAAGAAAGFGTASPVMEPPRPEVEALTPPPAGDDDDHDHDHDDHDDTGPRGEPSAPPLDGLLAQLAAQAVPVSTNGANKRRRIDSTEEVPDLDDGIEADVAETLRKDSQTA